MLRQLFQLECRKLHIFKYVKQFNCRQFRWYSSEITLKVKPYKLFKLEKGPSEEVSVTKDDALSLMKHMLTIRRIENTCANLYQAKLVYGFCHLYAGQEAICVGIKAIMGNKDTCITSYRSHGWFYMMSSSVHGLIAELLGRQTGCARGRGGSMHTYCHNFYGGNGIVGAHISLGTGLGFMHKYVDNKAVSFVFYGDGAANQGQTFESFNMAKLYNLPIVYVCENNHYSMGTSSKRGAANCDFYTRGDYIPGFWADGMDVLSVRQAADFARRYVTEGNGPIIIEADTYRYFGHSMSDPGVSYRNRDEIKHVRDTSDPITTFKKKIIDCELVQENEIQKIEAEVKKEVEAATDKAQADKVPDIVELTSDIYSLNLDGKIRTCVYTNSVEHRRIGSAVNFK